jgi:hypothetical protein
MVDGAIACVSGVILDAASPDDFNCAYEYKQEDFVGIEVVAALAGEESSGGVCSLDHVANARDVIRSYTVLRLSGRPHHGSSG